jgi:hypothetical protein
MVEEGAQVDGSRRCAATTGAEEALDHAAEEATASAEEACQRGLPKRVAWRAAFASSFARFLTTSSSLRPSTIASVHGSAKVLLK